MGQYKRFGEALGIAFQLQDDLMDAFPPEGFGKQIGGDILENKKTYLLLKAIELADREQQTQLTYLLAPGRESGSQSFRVLEIFRELGVESHTRQLIHHYFEQARLISTDFGTTYRFRSRKKLFTGDCK